MSMDVECWYRYTVPVHTVLYSAWYRLTIAHLEVISHQQYFRDLHTNRFINQMSRIGGFSSQGSKVVYVNVYDLHEHNDLLYQFGLGMYHSGVHIGREEYTFGNIPAYQSGNFIFIKTNLLLSSFWQRHFFP